MFRRLLSAALATILAATALLAATGTASAVSYGNVVNSPSSSAPWVLPLYYSTGATGTPRFVCTASALSPREILTAGHCAVGAGFYYVRVGANRLGSGTLVPIEGVIYNSKYSDNKFVNDTAVMRTLLPLNLASYARLGSAKMTRHINGSHPPQLRIYGWGEDQNRRLTRDLRTAVLVPQRKAAVAEFGTRFRPDLMLAAGKYHPRSRTYSGACYGDSGGPLVVVRRGIPHVVGITSWGVAGCDVKAPTVFTTVSAYRAWFDGARSRLPRAAANDNRAVPVNLAAPRVTGTAGLGQTLTCSAGSWTANAAAITTAWATSAGTSLGSGPTHTIGATDAAKSLVCNVTARSAAGSRTLSTALIALPARPSSYSYPSITGVPSYSSSLPSPGTVATCTAPTYTPAGSTVTYTWSWSTSSGTAGTYLGSGPTLTLDVATLTTLAGKYLTCATTATNAMGSETDVTSRSMANLAPPNVQASITMGPATAGGTATCSAYNYGAPYDSISYQWAIQSTSPIGADALAPGAILLGTTPTYTLTAGDVAALHGSYLACQVVATSWQGHDASATGKYIA